MAKQKEYSNGEVTIVWQADKCIHSEKCWRGLPDVFDPDNRPWINADGADTPAIKKQIDQCPSGALSYYMNAEGPNSKETAGQTTSVKVMAGGPLIVSGTLTIEGADGSTETKKGKTAFCRCGRSGDKPFCDGSHNKADFE